MNKLLYILFLLSAGLAFSQSAPELTNNLATNIDAADERQAWREALEIWTDDAVVFGGLTLAVDLPITEGGTGASTAGGALTNLGVSAFGQTLIDDATAAAAATTLGLGTGDSPIFTGGTYTGNLLVSGKLNVGNGAIDDTHIVNFVSEEDVVTEVMLHLEWNSPTPLAGDSNALLFSMYDSALNETEYSRLRSVIEDPTDGSEDGAVTIDVLNDGVLEQAVVFSHDEIIMNDNGADRNFIVKDDDTNEVFRITGGNGSIAMDGSTLFVNSANNRVGVGTNTPSAGYVLDVSGNALVTGNLTLDTNGGSGTEGIIAFDDGFGTPTLIQQTGGDIITFQDANNNGSHDAYELFFMNYSLGGGGLCLGGDDAYSPAVFVGTNYLNVVSGLQIYGALEVADQVELTSQGVNSDDSAMNYELTKSHIDWWGDMYLNVNGEIDTNNKFSINKSGDRFFHMFAYTGTAAGDGQWIDFHAPSYGIPYGSGAKGQLRDKWSFKFKFDSNATTNTDAHLWFVRGKAANATLPTASDVCFALKFEGEEDLMIAVYDGVTAHTTTIDLSTINTYFTNLVTQQEYMWTWNGSQVKVYGRYRLPAGTTNNDWSAWFTIGTLTPSGMAASTTNLTTANAYFLQHTPVTTTGFTKSFYIWDVAHSSTALIPN